VKRRDHWDLITILYVFFAPGLKDKWGGGKGGGRTSVFEEVGAEYVKGLGLGLGDLTPVIEDRWVRTYHWVYPNGTRILGYVGVWRGGVRVNDNNDTVGKNTVQSLLSNPKTKAMKIKQ
jgi:hypothetical protein